MSRKVDKVVMRRGSRPRRGRTEQGATLVELALVLPLFLAVVLGIFTGGHAYSQRISLVEAVREGARYGSSLALGTGPMAMADWETAVRNRVVQASGGELTAADVCVRLVLPSGASDCGVGDPPGASAEGSVHLVKVSAARPARLEFLFFTLTPTVSAKLAARYERDTG